MSKTQRDILIASILVLIFIFTFTTNILMPMFKKKNLNTTVAEQEAILATDAAAKNLIFVTNLRDNDIVLKNQEQFWEGEFGHDPFLLTSVASERGDIQSLEVKGVFWDEANPKALVNNKMLAKGDTILGYEILEIKYNAVVFWTGDKEVEVRIFKGGISPDDPKENS